MALPDRGSVPVRVGDRGDIKCIMYVTEKTEMISEIKSSRAMTWRNAINGSSTVLIDGDEDWVAGEPVLDAVILLGDVVIGLVDVIFERNDTSRN